MINANDNHNTSSALNYFIFWCIYAEIKEETRQDRNGDHIALTLSQNREPDADADDISGKNNSIKLVLLSELLKLEIKCLMIIIQSTQRVNI